MREAKTDFGYVKTNLPRYDGGVWQAYQFNSGSKLLLTSRGQELLKFNPELRADLLAYKGEVKNNLEGDSQASGNRQFFRSGGNSTVYKLGNRELLVKEATRDGRPSLETALDSMDYLYGACLRYLDPFVKVPDHYGLYIPAESDNEYLLMKKINSGITVKDILKGRISTDPEIQKMVANDFEHLKPRVFEAIQKVRKQIYIPFRNLLTDWTDQNVLVDFTSRSQTKPYTLWIIDQ